MNELSVDRLEERLSEYASAFEYPQTPDIAGAIEWEALRRRRKPGVIFSGQRLAWGIALLIVLLAGLMAVPPVRAQILEFLQIGAIRILLSQPSPTPIPTITASQPPGASLATQPTGSQAERPTATPMPTSTPRPFPFQLSRPSTLSQAEAAAGFRARLPAYPEDLGPPDLVFAEDFGGPAIILVWLEPDQQEKTRLSLMQMIGDALIEKLPPRVIAGTQVNNQPALWTEGAHSLRYRSRAQIVELVVEGNVLIWQEGETTYRLEGDLTMEEAVRIAESLR
jgi:hypothetical protein